MNIYAQLSKVDESKRLVYGIATAEKVDRSGEIMDYATSKPFFEKWVAETMEATNGQSQGNLRAMHGKTAAGKLIKVEFDDANRQIPVVAKVVDDQEWKKVLEGVYTGFSIGGAYANKWEDAEMKKEDGTTPVTRFTAKPNELSLVDRACLPDAKFFSIEKADGSTAEVEFVVKAETPVTTDEDKKEMTPEEKAKKAKEDKAANAGEDKGEVKADEDKEAEKAEYVVNGTESDVAALAKLMEDSKINVGQVIAYVKSSLSAAEAVAKADALKGTILALEADGTLQKGMYTVSRLASAICTLKSLSDEVAYEQAAEKDASSMLPESMSKLLKAACDLLQMMVVEETAELIGQTSMNSTTGYGAVMQMMDKVDGMSPVSELIKSVGDETGRAASIESLKTFIAKFAPTHVAKPEAAEALLKAEIDAINKAHQETVSALSKRLEILENQPAPARVVLRAVAKSDEVLGDTKPEKVNPILNKDGGINDVATSIKELHKSGGTAL
jgi:hypothetical protein